MSCKINFGAQIHQEEERCGCGSFHHFVPRRGVKMQSSADSFCSCNESFAAMMMMMIITVPRKNYNSPEEKTKIN